MSDPVLAWLAAQRESVERWLAASQSAAGVASVSEHANTEAQRWWQSLAQTLSPQAQLLAQQLAQLGPEFLAGTGDALFDLFGTRPPSAQPASDDLQSPAFNGWPTFDRWRDLAPIGYFREHQAHAQELIKALDEQGRVAAQLSGAIARVHADALEALAAKTAALAQSGESVDDTRRLYSLWIESAEQAFAQHARGELFGRLQGDWVNACLRVRIAQQSIAEELLKALDLPTRAELNSVHRRLKDMRERIERLEAERSRK